MDEEGQEGPIKCIFLCKFHPKLGPVIVCQYPEGYISKDVFESIHNYLITKIRIKKKTITLSVFGLKVSGYPNEILNSKYLRNALIFNLCFVCDYKSRSIQYEPIVKKISEYLENLELENGFLSSEECEEKLPAVLKQVLEDINEKGKCTIRLTLQSPPIGERRMSCRLDKKPDFDIPKSNCGKPERRYTVFSSDHKKGEFSSVLKRENGDGNNDEELNNEILHYKNNELNVSVLNLKQVVGVRSEPIQVQDYHVPFLLCSRTEVSRASSHWDLTTQQILPCIDGVSHIAKIAADADVHVNLVEACIQNLVHHRVVKVLPIFQYSNMYTTLPGLQKLYTSPEIQEECLKVVAKNHPRFPQLSDVMQMYSSLIYGASIRDLCLRFKPHDLNIDERLLIHFGLICGFIRRIHQYPVLPSYTDTDDLFQISSSSLGALYRMCNGHHSVDEMCCKFGMTYQEVIDRLERHPGIAIIMK